jgi:8-oxo-dGTP diphosphatase
VQVKQVFSHYPWEGSSAGGFLYCPACASCLIPADSSHKLRPTCPSCGFVQYRNPLPTVSILIADGDRVLLGLRGGVPGRGTWALPSGYIEHEDDFLTTAIREAKEETGLDIELCSLIGVNSSFYSPSYHFLSIFVTARVVGGELAAGDDLEAVNWFPLGGPLPKMGFQEDVRIIQMYAAGAEGLPIDPDYAVSRTPVPSYARGFRQAT